MAFITAVHLRENSPTARRDSIAGRAFPLGEADRPVRGSGTPAQRQQELIAIIRYLHVERSPRYQPAAGSTYCNIYAYDYCYLSGVYLPRVWWTAKAIGDLAAGKTVQVKYGDTVHELNANALHDWLRDFGSAFGWSRVAGLNDLQNAADQGSVCMICAQRTDLDRPGHICAVVPEEAPHVAVRGPSGVKLPLQSQAGATNFCFDCGTTKWWAGAKFRAFGFWVHS